VTLARDAVRARSMTTSGTKRVVDSRGFARRLDGTESAELPPASNRWKRVDPVPRVSKGACGVMLNHSDN